MAEHLIISLSGDENIGEIKGTKSAWFESIYIFLE